MNAIREAGTRQPRPATSNARRAPSMVSRMFTEEVSQIPWALERIGEGSCDECYRQERAPRATTPALRLS